MYWNESEEILKLAFELRNNAGFISKKNDDLLKAADLFNKVINYYNTLVIYWENISEDKMNLTIANKEHLLYEMNFSLYIYNYRIDKIDEALKYLKLSNKYIESAVSRISKLSSSIGKDCIKSAESDRRQWTYYMLQNEPLYQSLLAERTIHENKISLALDYYKSAKDKSEELIEITKNYLDVLEPNYERIVLSNFYKFSSNYAFKLAELQRKDEDINSFNPIITESIILVWEAYKYTLESIKIFPEHDQHRLVLKNQLNYLNELLSNNKKSWSILLMKIGDYDFKMHLQQLDINKYNKAAAQLFISDLNVSFMIKLISKFKNKKLNEDTYKATKNRIEYMKRVIEDNDGYRLFYKNGKLVGDEEKLQLIFRLTWATSDADVNREVNNGRGSVDFKISKGAYDITLVEFKLAKNTKLKQNLRNQVSIYERANNTKNSFKVILYFTKEELEDVNKALSELELTSDPSIYVIDARCDNKESASRVR